MTKTISSLNECFSGLLNYLLSLSSSSMTFSLFSNKALSLLFCAATTIYNNTPNHQRSKYYMYFYLIYTDFFGGLPTIYPHSMSHITSSTCSLKETQKNTLNTSSFWSKMGAIFLGQLSTVELRLMSSWVNVNTSNKYDSLLNESCNICKIRIVHS